MFKNKHLLKALNALTLMKFKTSEIQMVECTVALSTSLLVRNDVIEVAPHDAFPHNRHKLGKEEYIYASIIFNYF